MKNKIPAHIGQVEASKNVLESDSIRIQKRPKQNLGQIGKKIQKSSLNKIQAVDNTQFKHVWPTSGTKRYYSNKENGAIYEKRILVTPDLAQTWRQSTLAVEARTGHRLNRNANPKRIVTMARMMQNGQWPYVGDTIKLSPPDEETKEPIIVDGWHRICATIRANLPIEFLVIFNIPHELFAYIDIGRSRNAADILVVNGFLSQKFLASAARTVWYLERREASMQTLLTNPEILNTVENHKQLGEWIDEIRSADNAFQNSVIVAVSYWISRTGDPRADEFLKGLLKGEGNFHSGNPIMTLRRRILNDETLKGWNSKNRIHLMSLMFQAWEYFLTGQKVDKFRVGSAFNWPGGAPYLKIKAAE
jgi:hypothetical protein